MAAVGVAVVELAALLYQHLGYAVAHHHAAQRDVAAGNGLGKSHQVGLVAKFFIRKPVAQAAKGANHLVADEQDAVFVNDALDLGPVGGRRNDHATGPLHRLANKGRHLVRADFQNFCFQPARRPYAKGVAGLAGQAFLEKVGLLNVRDVGNRQIALRVHAAHAAQRGPGHGAAVVAVNPPNNHLALGLAQQIPVAAHHAHIGVIALTSAGRIKHVLKAAVAHSRSQGRQLGCQGGGRHVGGLEKAVVVRQLHHLRVRRVGQLFAAIAYVHAPQAAHGVQHAFAF